jgi:hypothetical protein
MAVGDVLMLRHRRHYYILWWISLLTRDDGRKSSHGAGLISSDAMIEPQIMDESKSASHQKSDSSKHDNNC